MTLEDRGLGACRCSDTCWQTRSGTRRSTSVHRSPPLLCKSLVPKANGLDQSVKTLTVS